MRMKTNNFIPIAASSAKRPRPLPATRALLALAVLSTLAGCEAIGTIFEAGVWVGVVIVIVIVAVVALIAGILRR
jgi:hypothetical protein